MSGLTSEELAIWELNQIEHEPEPEDEIFAMPDVIAFLEWEAATAEVFADFESAWEALAEL